MPMVEVLLMTKVESVSPAIEVVAVPPPEAAQVVVATAPDSPVIIRQGFPVLPSPVIRKFWTIVLVGAAEATNTPP